MKPLSRAALIAALIFSSSSCASVKGAVVYRGNYYWGHEVETFDPCGSEQSFWVIGSDAVLQPLREETKKLSTTRGKPYQPIYVEIIAVSEGKAEDGFAADYDGVYRITSVKISSASIPSDCNRTR